MRTLQDASTSWQQLKRYSSLAELREAVRLDGGHVSPAAAAGLRSAMWKAFLVFETVDTAQWPNTLTASRSAYNSLRTHFLRYVENPDELEGGDGPLDDNPDPHSTWAVLKKDEALRAEIQQDVDRCMPENTFFRQPETQRMLLDILFVWCKLNQDVSYRQGMHELLAPILWVVERDAIDLGPSSKAHGEDVTVRTVFDAESIEHDAFALFGQLMQSAKGFYEQTTHQGNENPIVARSRRIFEEMLPQVDPELAQHLRRIDIVPQVFLIRWVRLLFGREYPFDDMLALWDIVFAEDTTLEIVDYICLVMLLRIRWALLDSDYNGALTILLRYPQPDRDHPAPTYALDALYLKDHLDTDGSGYLILKHTGKPLQPHGGAATPPALQRNITAFSGLPSVIASPSTRPNAAKRQSTNFEAMLQSTAKQLYARGGKAVRTAVDEVHKRAQEIRDAQTPSLPPRAPSYSRGGPGALYKRIAAMEKRNKDLAKLLQGAVGELWEYQRVVSEEREGVEKKEETTRKENVERLSLAIARVQFVQVYLGDGSLPLPDVETSTAENGAEKAMGEEGVGRGAPSIGATDALDEKAATRAPTDTPADRSSGTSRLKDPNANDDNVLADPSTFDFDESRRATPVRTGTPSHPSNPVISIRPPTTDHRPRTPPTNPARPPLSEGQYSWMLGGDEEASVNTGPARTSTPDRVSKGRSGFLFGDGGGDGDAGPKEVTSRSPRGKTRRQKATSEVVKGGEGGLGSGSGGVGLND